MILCIGLLRDVVLSILQESVYRLEHWKIRLKLRPLYIFCTVVVVAIGTHINAAERGPVTNLLLPRYVSLKTNEANARRGPSLSHRIDWIFKKKGMPLEIYGEYDNWRRVRDAEGAGGWIHYSLLSGIRSIIVISSMADLHRKSDQNSMIMARIEQNYIADLRKCIKDWCEIDAGKYDGWIRKTDIWGVAPDEIR
tara:strand:- start:410 stop:994 length:585 start_codon:yes stop_codon:yes gene_type:complete